MSTRTRWFLIALLLGIWAIGMALVSSGNANAQNTDPVPDVCDQASMLFLKALHDTTGGVITEEITAQIGFGLRLNPTSNLATDGSVVDPSLSLEPPRQVDYRASLDPAGNFTIITCNISSDVCAYGSASLSYDWIARNAPFLITQCNYIAPSP